MKEYMFAVFFDIEKAYDTLWKGGLPIKLNKLGIGGKFYNLVLDFERTFQVKIGEEISDPYNILNGTPQGSVISPILFNLMINDLFNKINKTGICHLANKLLSDVGSRSRTFCPGVRVLFLLDSSYITFVVVAPLSLLRLCHVNPHHLCHGIHLLPHLDDIRQNVCVLASIIRFPGLLQDI